MTDNDIIKALECHSLPSNSCGSNCPYLMCDEVMCTKKLSKDALNLINRQKAEIERLKELLQNKKGVRNNDRVCLWHYYRHCGRWYRYVFASCVDIGRKVI